MPQIAGNNGSAVVTMRFPFTGASGSTGTFAGWLVDSDIVIHNAFLRITTASTGASTLDIGVAANATTASDNLFDGQSGTPAGVFLPGGTNGRAGRVLTAGQAITVTEASGDVNGLVAELIAEVSFL